MKSWPWKLSSLEVRGNHDPGTRHAGQARQLQPQQVLLLVEERILTGLTGLAGLAGLSPQLVVARQ